MDTEQPLPPQPVRGKLKIFLGYAPGVGKAHAMLEEARARRDAGVDVVVGRVATYGRPDLIPLLRNLEVVPPYATFQDGQLRHELDLDAIEVRNPEVVLIDNLAHRNAPGLRHVRRCQDVLELLDAGIDVYTTLNIQHLESLNDIVAQITGLTVRDTVPDDVFEAASEIELVDLPVEELLARVDAGQIPIPEAESGAAAKFFRPGNLTALRELALRRTAERVDEQMRAYMASHAIAGPWPAAERILVCVSPSPLSERLVRTGRRLAQRLNAEWIAVYVETPDHGKLAEADRERVARTLQLAESLGAQSLRLSGHGVAESVVAFALTRNVTKIVAGKPLRPRWREWLDGGSLIDRILRLSQDLDVYVISSAGPPAERTAPTGARGPVRWRAHGLSALLVLLATLIGLPFRSLINPTNLVMPYLAAVILAALWLGRNPAIVASFLSVIAFDIIFVPPVYTFGVDDAEYFLTFVGLLTVGVVIGTLTARAREQEVAARQRETQTAALYELSQKLAAVNGSAAISRTAVEHVRESIGHPTALFVSEDGGAPRAEAQTPDFEPGEQGLETAGWVWRHGQPAGQFTATLTTAGAYYLPLQTSGHVVGVLAIDFPDEQHILTGEQRRLLLSTASQVALALEKASLAEKARQARLLEETEKLQAALLNSISHDLRTPLATITGTLSSLHDDAALLTPAAQRDLVDTAWEEARRLNRLVGNLLDMTRLESGTLKVMRQPADVEDLIGSALAQLRGRLAERTVHVDVADRLPLVDVDFTLMIQVVVNLVDNALKYAPAGAPIEIVARREEKEIVLEVRDQGPGVPEGDPAALFSKFFRGAQRGDSGRGGTGLGLSIARGIVEVHGGRIWAENRPGGGAVFAFTMTSA